MSRWLSFTGFALFGLLPSGLFFVWMANDLTLPILSHALDVPWIHLQDLPLPVLLLTNLALVALFGFTHSALARLHPTLRSRRHFIIVSGLTASLIMGLWQHTGRIVWILPFPRDLQRPFPYVVFTLLGIVSLHVLGGPQGAAEFLGLSPPQTNHPLRTGGWYARMRHPLYAFLLLALAATPLMTLDRLWLGLCFAFYLTLGIRREEAKLIQRYGKEYIAYQKQTPAILPKLF